MPKPLPGLSPEQLANLKNRCDAQQAADAACELLRESVTGHVETYWAAILAEAQKHVKLPPQPPPELVPMTDVEAEAFGRELMPFGRYVETPVFRVSLQYIDYIIRTEEELQEFKTNLRRYAICRLLRGDTWVAQDLDDDWEDA